MKNANNIKIGVIYKYTSPSGKIYVGQTINEASRKNKHKSETSKSDTYFGKAIRKYGWENLKYETIIKFKPNANSIFVVFLIITFSVSLAPIKVINVPFGILFV